MDTVLLTENLKPFSWTHLFPLLTHSWSRLMTLGNDLPLKQKAKSSTNTEDSESFRTAVTISLILILKSTGDSILPWGTPFSCTWKSERVEPILTWNKRSERKLLMKHGSRPRKPSSCRSRNMLCFQVVSYAFSRSKKMATTCSFLIKASLTKLSNLTKWSTVERFLRKPHWTSDKWPSDSRHHISRAFTMRSIVLQRQLVSAMGL